LILVKSGNLAQWDTLCQGFQKQLGCNSVKEKLLKLLETKGDLPPLSDILINLEGRINNPNTDIEEISELIQTDPVLSGRLIKLSNSVLFGGGRDKVDDLNSAIMRLGLKMVLDLAYTLELPSAFKKPKSFNHMDFWKHSLGVAYLSRTLALHAGGSKEELEASYLSGLMHDVGILVFDYLIPNEYEAFIRNIGDAEKGLEELELETFGISHPELGARFVEKWWPVSKQVVSSIRKHHGPLSDSITSPGISRFINCANQIANNHEIRNGVSPYICPMGANLMKVLKLSEEDLLGFVENTRAGVEEAESILMG
jgi:HD-like signal output (HDOD) protein